MEKTALIGFIVLFTIFSPQVRASESDQICPIIDGTKKSVPNEVLAKTFFKRGAVAFKKEKYNSAAVAFIASYRATSDSKIAAQMLYNIAVSLDRSGDKEKALRVYQCYLGTGLATETERREIEGRMFVLAEVRPEPESQPREDARPKVVAPESQPVRQPVASRPVVLPPAALPEVAPSTSRPVPPALPMVTTLPPATAPASQIGNRESIIFDQPAQIEKAVSRSRPYRTWAWVTGSIALASFGAGLGLGISAKLRLNEMEESCGRTAAGCPSSDIYDLEHRALSANILYGIGGASALTSLVLFLVDWKIESRRIALTSNGSRVNLVVQW